ncbi:MAG: homoaconitase [Planctomycetes bacterium]|nr:homoaconitase [Planctomycetota bacterium]NOG52931.1 homoaconitase [Planctomycetota bacterium]
MTPPLTLVEKIATQYAVGLNAGSEFARQGSIVTIRPKHIMTHDNTSAVMSKFKSIGAARVHDPSQPVFAIDHDIQNTTPENLGKYARIAQFARQQGIDFYPAGTGISHQVMVEYGYVTPGSMCVGSDSHSNIYGALNALGTPVVRTDAACIWAVGTTWWKVPPVARVTLTGSLQPGVVGKDVIITLCGLFNNDEVLNMAVEFTGPGLASLTMDQRLSIANMTTEWGALVGLFPFDDVLRDFLYDRADVFAKRGDDPAKYSRADVDAWYESRVEADADARYALDLTLDLSTVIPHVSGPDHVKVMHALPEIEAKRIAVNRAYLLSCVNARTEDLADAAAVLKDKKVAEGVTLYVAAASTEVLDRAVADGTWKTLLDAGAVPLPPGCGTCIGLGQGTLEPGEVGISATNRNFKGRMGSRDAEAYLASPAVVAASAVAGYICAPTTFDNTKPAYSIDTPAASRDDAASTSETEILEGFPSQVTGRALWLPVDNLNTDGIYSGKMTYRDNVTPEEMADAAMENYDPNFKTVCRPGDIVVSGSNFGTGSSREQAATCLAQRGIPCVIAASFSETYARNAFNNGFIVLECAALSEYLRTKYAAVTDAATIAGPKITIDYQRSTITCTNENDGSSQSFTFPPLSPTAQQLVIAGGAENLARKQLDQ